MMKKIVVMSLAMICTTAEAEYYTRGIGQYPGAASEYFGPAVGWTAADRLTNVARHRVAYASSSVDYNHTAHLVATVYDLNGRMTAQQKVRINSSDDSTQAWTKLSKLMPQAPSDVYFLRLQLTGKQGIVSENTYIMSGKENHYQALRSLAKAEVAVSTKTDGESMTVVLKNKSRVPAPMVRLNLKGADGLQILPVVYSDNYLTLMPGESRTVSISWRGEDARGQQPCIEVTELINK